MPVCVAVAPGMVDTEMGPPGGEMQMLNPAIRFVQYEFMVGFHATSCWKVVLLARAIASQVSPLWTL